jgi:hypothetical protein
MLQIFFVTISNSNYVDDTNILITGTNEFETVTKTNLVYDMLMKWVTDNRLYINSAKTRVLVFGGRRSDICLDDMDLRLPGRSGCVSVLGLTIDETLTWGEHIDGLAGRLAKANYALRHLARYCGLETLKTLYFACFQSLLKYGIAHWGRSGGMQRVFVQQKRAVRRMMELSARDSYRDSFRSLGVMTVPALYVYDILCFAFRNRDSFGGVQHGHATRCGHSDMRVEQHSTARYQRHTHCNACKIYNHLPRECKSIGPYALFKTAIKRMLVSRPLYTVEEYFGS